METKDCIKNIKLSKYSLDASGLNNSAGEGVDPTYSDQKDGIVRLAKKLHQSDDGFRTIQEQHNANHALYYFSIIADSLIRGWSTGDDGAKIRRIKAHMMNLREFVGDDKAPLKMVINMLLERLDKFCLNQREQLALFIYENWPLIQSFAQAYGHHEKCFPEGKSKMIRDIVFGKHYFRLWWWKMKMRKSCCEFRKILGQEGESKSHEV